MFNNRALFISGFREELLSSNGVAKKINLEIKTLRLFGFKVDYIEFRDKKVYLNQENECRFICNEKATFFDTMHDVFKNLDSKEAVNYDLYYYRYEHFCFAMISFFKRSKKNNNKLKIVAELPTFMKKWSPGAPIKSRVKFLVKRFLDSNFEKYIDHMVTFSSHNRIFGIDTIKIENFVDIDLVPQRNMILNDTIDLLALAQITPAHGFDRVIKGLHRYVKSCNKTKIYLHVVGDGIYKQDLVELTTNLDMHNYVKFYGALGGEQLNEIFNISDIGIGSLAFFRKGTTKGSELKVREYTARGLPFVYSAEEPQLEGIEFALKIPFDESDLNIEEVIQFHNRMLTNSNLIVDMRKFAEEEFTCQKQFDKILTVVFGYGFKRE